MDRYREWLRGDPRRSALIGVACLVAVVIALTMLGQPLRSVVSIVAFVVIVTTAVARSDAG